MSVLLFARYLNDDDERPYEYIRFCGSCRGQLEHPTALRRTPDDLDSWYPTTHPVTYNHWAFCPWCGTAFDPEWWQWPGSPLQNPRVVDHYRNPGSHAGDKHTFDDWNNLSGHVMASTDPTHVCPCGPTIVPGLMGCEVHHHTFTEPS